MTRALNLRPATIAGSCGAPDSTTEALREVHHLAQPVDATAGAAIDIIVPVYKNPELTSRCLNSLADHTHEISAHEPRLIVINDSPGDHNVRDVLTVFAGRGPFVTILENDHNLGFVGTVNRGLAIASQAGRDVILVNADTQTFPETLRNLVAAAYADPRIGFVSPRSNNAALCSLPHLDGVVVTDPAVAYSRWQLLSRTMPSFHFTPTAVGFYLYIKNSVIANFGFLDPEFGIGYEEENDLIFRANKVGYRAALANNAFAFHAGSASFKLLSMNLQSQQAANLEKAAARHSEYLPLIRRYEESPHFRAEALLSHALPSSSDRLKLVFDLSSVGPAIDGTSEMSLALINAFYERHAASFDMNVVCTEEVFKFHKLDRNRALRRHEPELCTTERFAIGIRLGQPFDVQALRTLEDLSVINVYGMLDTIADDCGYLSIRHQLETLWGHVARHANGLVFISRFSERALIARYPEAQHLPNYVRLLPTRLSSYKKPDCAPAASDHVLIIGNHFVHKAADSTAEIIRTAFPSTPIVVIGGENRVAGNLRAYKAGTLDEQLMESLRARASVIVLPSHVEGFGLGLMHALAARKVVVARDIPATREILATYKEISGLFLYANDREVVDAVRLALIATESGSHVEDDSAEGWSEWVDGFADYCLSLARRDDIFERLVKRIQAADLVRKAELIERLQLSSPAPPVDKATYEVNPRVNSKDRVIRDPRGREWSPVRRLKQLLALDGEEFVYRAYVTILNRLPDSGGLVNYLAELQSGIDKLEIASRLVNSTEGRKAGLPLPGYRSTMLRRRLFSALGMSSRPRA